MSPWLQTREVVRVGIAVRVPFRVEASHFLYYHSWPGPTPTLCLPEYLELRSDRPASVPVGNQDDTEFSPILSSFRLVHRIGPLPCSQALLNSLLAAQFELPEHHSRRFFPVRPASCAQTFALGHHQSSVHRSQNMPLSNSFELPG